MKRLTGITLIMGLLIVFAISVGAQEKPEKSLCPVCAINGELRMEKVKAVAQHKDHSYYFCSDKCKVEFLTDPIAYIPSELPRAAPSFVVVDMEGADVSSDFEGKITLVDFWATWCKPCVKSMPEIQRLFEKYHDQGFRVMGISIDDNEDRISRINKFVKKHEISYPVYSDAKEVPAWHTYHVKAVPVMFLINRKGEVVAEWKGHVDNEALAEEVTKLVESGSAN